METTMTAERFAIEFVKFNELGEVVLNKKQRDMVYDAIEDIRRDRGRFDTSIEIEDGVWIEMSGWCASSVSCYRGDYLTPDSYDVTFTGEIEEMYALIYDEDTNSLKRYDVAMDLYNECHKRLIEDF